MNDPLVHSAVDQTQNEGLENKRFKLELPLVLRMSCHTRPIMQRKQLFWESFKNYVTQLGGGGSWLKRNGGGRVGISITGGGGVVKNCVT